MNEAIQIKILHWLENIENAISTEMPLFVQEVAAYGFWSNLVMAFLLFIAMVFTSYLIYRFSKKAMECDYEIFGVPAIICSFLLIIMMVEFPKKCNEFIKAATAPRLYVIERFMGK